MLSAFLQNVFETGRVELPRPQPNADIDVPAARTILENADTVWRACLPAGLPELEADVAIWGAITLYRAAQFLIYRDLGPEVIPNVLFPRQPAPVSAAEHYSGDLCLRFLKDVLRLAKVASENDPLNDQIILLLQDWPLSAVGIGPSVTTDSPVWIHESLRLMYLDRVVQCGDHKEKTTDHVSKELELWTRSS